METLRKRIQQIKKKRPGYKEMLDFYLKVREEQEKTKAFLSVEPILIKKEWKDLLMKEGFPLLERKDFPLDMEASLSLFQSLCQIGKGTNPHMAEQVKKIEEALDKKRIDLKDLFKDGSNTQKIEQIANQSGLDKKVFLFLIQNSTKPSVQAGVEKLLNELNTENWTKGSCPICGSLPYLALLREEVGKRFFLCSYCGYEWRTVRLMCPFCSNRDQESLHYFYAEGENAFRVDLCEKCHQYIKTVDLRKIKKLDLPIEDLATVHLDLLATQKGYERPAPNPWID